jgi:hypothetical protein
MPRTSNSDFRLKSESGAEPLASENLHAAEFLFARMLARSLVSSGFAESSGLSLSRLASQSKA